MSKRKYLTFKPFNPKKMKLIGIIFAVSFFVFPSVRTTKMRIFLSVLVIVLGANLLINLLDSSLVDVMEERQNTIEKLMNEG
jgi:hypothetical protein